MVQIVALRNDYFFVPYLTGSHWHGAAPDSWFSHLAVEVPGENGSSEWLEAVSDKDYSKCK